MEPFRKRDTRFGKPRSETKTELLSTLTRAIPPAGALYTCAGEDNSGKELDYMYFNKGLIASRKTTLVLSAGRHITYVYDFRTSIPPVHMRLH